MNMMENKLNLIREKLSEGSKTFFVLFDEGKEICYSVDGEPLDLRDYLVQIFQHNTEIFEVFAQSVSLRIQELEEASKDNDKNDI